MQRLSDFHKKLRREMTIPERKLWSILRRKQIEGLSFRRQVPIGKYIVDFLCLERKLIIEVDGDEHALRQGYDETRTKELERSGYFVLRYGNNDVMQNLDGVVSDIVSTSHG